MSKLWQSVKITWTFDKRESSCQARKNTEWSYMFPQKYPNCPKWIYADVEMESHYDDFEEFGKCEAKKT